MGDPPPLLVTLSVDIGSTATKVICMRAYVISKEERGQYYRYCYFDIYISVACALLSPTLSLRSLGGVL